MALERASAGAHARDGVMVQGDAQGIDLGVTVFGTRPNPLIDYTIVGDGLYADG